MEHMLKLVLSLRRINLVRSKTPTLIDLLLRLTILNIIITISSTHTGRFESLLTREKLALRIVSSWCSRLKISAGICI